MKKHLITFLLALVPLLAQSQSQNPIRNTGIDIRTLSFDDRTPHDHSVSLAPYTLYPDGIVGQALDFSSAAPNRQPITLDSMTFTLNGKQVYSIALWVRVPSGEKASENGNVIATNVNKETQAGGFTIGAAANGSWYAGFTDDNGSSLWYEPTHARQPIDDGRWHLLALTYNGRMGKAWLYYDGRNVAIYNLREMAGFNGRGKIRIGGADSTEWNAFNGQIDEFSLYEQQLSPEAIFRIYSSYYTLARWEQLPERCEKLRLMGFNIWHGGNETGSEAGPRRVAEIIRDSGADIVGLIETYGSGAKIADQLGYCLYLHSSNLSILSKYPIVEPVDFFQPFNCSAAKIRVSRSQTINYINLWLHYLPDTRQQLKDRVSVDSIVASEWTTRAAELEKILREASDASFIDGSVPTFVSGDFNIDSHLDWIEATRDEHEGYVIPWPTSLLMDQAGFTDSYRKLYPDPKTYPCKTWSPAYKPEENGFYYRIDFIYYKGTGVEPVDSKMIDTHPVRFPSDHAAVITEFKL